MLLVDLLPDFKHQKHLSRRREYCRKNRASIRLGSAQYYQRSKAKIRAKQNLYKEENKEIYSEKEKQRRKNNPLVYLNRRLKKYGITSEKFDEMNASQKGVCKICGKPPETRRLDVDHDHKTGMVRGLLCQRCNKALGLFLDNPLILKAAAIYLENGG